MTLQDRSEIERIVESARVHVRYEVPREGPLVFGSVPFPDDLYASDSGRPGFIYPPPDGRDVSRLAAAVVDDVNQATGFSVTGPIFAEFDGELDPQSLPETPADSLAADSGVFVLDVDTNSSTAFSRVPVAVTATETAQGTRLVIRPQGAHLFVPNRRYAVVITTDLTDERGEPVGPSYDFAEIRGPSYPLLEPRKIVARQRFGPVFSVLEGRGISTDEVVSVTVFRAQDVQVELLEALEVVTGTIEADGATRTETVERDELDALFGVQGEPNVVSHANLSQLLHGSLPVPQLLSSTSATPGMFIVDGDGVPIVQRVEEVPFTLFLPPVSDAELETPLLIYVHGTGGERGDGAAVADRFAGAGVAVLAIDMPLHGQRGPFLDESNRFTEARAPDGFGDGRGNYWGPDVGAAFAADAHPGFLRDGMRQGALDVLYVLASARNGGLSEVTDRSLDWSNVAMLGVDTGATIAMMVASLDDTVQLVEAAFVGGATVDNWVLSPHHQDALANVAAALGVDVPEPHLMAEPMWAFYQALLDAADPLPWASVLLRKPVNILLLRVDGDEAVAAEASERVSGILSASDAPRGEEVLEPSSGGVARVVLNLGRGAHNTLQSGEGAWWYEPGEDKRFVTRERPVAVDNPRPAALDAISQFVTSWRSCLDEAAANAPCYARVAAPR